MKKVKSVKKIKQSNKIKTNKIPVIDLEKNPVVAVFRLLFHRDGGYVMNHSAHLNKFQLLGALVHATETVKNMGRPNTLVRYPEKKPVTATIIPFKKKIKK